jgi:hypothetical protein
MASASEAEALRQRWKELDEQRVACEGRLKGLQNPLANGLQYRPSEDVDRAKEGDGAEAGDGAARAGPRPGFARRGPPDGPSPHVDYRGPEPGARYRPGDRDRDRDRDRGHYGPGDPDRPPDRKRARDDDDDGDERAAAAERAAERRRDNEGRGDENRARRPGRPSGGGPEAGGVRRVPDAPSRSGRGVYEDSAVKARSRRLFGGLLGHLGSAKKKLEADADVLAKRRSQQDFAASKAHRLKREALAAAKHACKEVKYKELAARDEILTNLRKTEAALLHADFSAKCDLLKAFLRTEAEPKIFWLPKRHTDATRAKLAATAESLDGDVAAKAEAYEAFSAEHDKAFATRRERREKAAEHATAKFTNVPGAPPRAASPSRRDAPRRRESDEARRDEGRRDEERRDEGRRESGGDRPPLDVEDELAAIDDMDDERDREPEPEILS